MSRAPVPPPVPPVDTSLLKKYDVSGPRYTSYPTAPQFTEDFGPAEHEAALQQSSAADAPPPLSLYVHLPFCQQLCYFCGCNMLVAHDRDRSDRYLDVVEKEMDAVAAAVGGKDRPVAQLHWGGGTPTFLPPAQLRRLVGALRARFGFADDAEIGIEVDPRDCTNEQLEVLGELGFNRLSMGVQDFRLEVQQAINRVQTEEETRRVVEHGRRHGMDSVNIDLIYGLPHQTPETFAKTLDTVIDIAPDRFAVFNFAYLPEMIKHQKVIQREWLPSPDQKLAILRDTIERLCGAGYLYIGMDHFARPEDELAVLQRQGRLHRNFQGYTTHGDCDLIGLGVSAISQVGPTYSQNQKVLSVYEATAREAGIATMRGFRLSRDDEMRRAIIMQLISNFVLDVPAVEKRWGVRFAEDFADEIEALKPYVDDGLVEVDPAREIRVTDVGRLLIRNICMVFDTYLRGRTTRFSRTV